jgi:site-specific DNA-adenine methylase
MKAPFYFSYLGNKYNEMDTISKFVMLRGINKIIEPFCGSAAFSFFIWEHALDKNQYDFYLSDIDENLISFFLQIKNKKGFKKHLYNQLQKFKNITREQWNSINKKNNKSIYEYVLSMTYKSMRNVNPVGFKNFPKYDKLLNHIPYDDFVKLANFKLSDYKNVMNRYKNDSQAFIFLDPPYLGFVGLYDNENLANVNNDFYYYLLNFIKTCKCRIMVVLKQIPLIDIVFKDYIIHTYDKTYELSKKDVKHIIITNY